MNCGGLSTVIETLGGWKVETKNRVTLVYHHAGRGWRVIEISTKTQAWVADFWIMEAK